DAPDKQTVRLVMKKPYAYTEAIVGSSSRGAIVPQEWLASANLKKDAAMIHFFGLRAEVVAYPYVKNYPAGLGSLGSALIGDLWLDK
ncbi:MAG TPA: hypothetical protein VIK11_12565, partial [Tepidiformaceae bacterium]